jgi:hypothetical protein
MLRSLQLLPALMLLAGFALSTSAAAPVEVKPLPTAMPLPERAAALQESFQRRLAVLNEQLVAASAAAERQALQQQISDLKATHEIEMVELQLQVAQELGKSEATQEIQAALTFLREKLREQQAARAAQSVPPSAPAPQR